MLRIVSLRLDRFFFSQPISKTTNIRPAVLGCVRLVCKSNVKKQMNSGSGLKNEGKGKTERLMMMHVMNGCIRLAFLPV